jgi:hypothetical protein
MSNRNRSGGSPSRTVAAVRKRPLAAALLVALALPGFAYGQTAKEVELEARVAELEKMVQQLVSQQQQTGTPAIATQPAPAAAPATAVAGGKAIQATTILPSASPGTAFSFGGFIKLDAMATDTSDGRIADGSAGRLFYVPSTIPVGPDGAEGGDAYTDMHAQFSRFWLAADHVTDAGDKVKAYIEADMYGGGSNALLGNETSTNTYGVSLRHAYVSWNEWLAGQTWSNFQDVGALPDTVDFVGPVDGVVFVRQAQLRYTNGPWSFSLENPQTTVTPHLSAAPRFNSGDNIAPDFTGRWTTRGDWGHFTVAGLLRQFKAGEETATGGALSASGKFNLGANDDIRYAINGGSGIGRYLAFGMGTDVVQDIDGDLEALDGYGGYVAWRHALGPKLRGNLMYSAAHFDNDVGLTGQGVTERAHSLRANLIYSPFSKLDIGAELTFGQRFLEDDREGDLSRLHTTVKYSF